MQEKEACIYLLHGFASAPKYPSDKADTLEKVFEQPVRQMSYDSAASFTNNFEVLKEQVVEPPCLFVGTSLGAFYGSKLAEHFYENFQAMPVLLNPCHNPYQILQGKEGIHMNFVTGQRFELTKQTVASYKGVSFIGVPLDMPRKILVNMDDELIDPSQTIELYQESIGVISFESGGHRFQNMDSDEVYRVLKSCVQR